MDIEIRLQVLDQHLDLLIDSTEQCQTLKGESVASTLLLIQLQIREIRVLVKEQGKS